MSLNITTFSSNTIVGIFTFVGVESLLKIISTIVSIIIIHLVYTTPNLRSPTNLLISNTCVCTLIFSSVATIDTFLYLFENHSTDWSCRFQSYLNYVCVCLVIYSYVIQTVSRLFWTVLHKYNHLKTIKCHFYLIFFQNLLSFSLPLSTLITQDVVFRPWKLCLVPVQYRLHTFYLVNVCYVIPLLSIALLYIRIYRHSKNSSSTILGLIHGRKRDRKLARNILILLSIFLFGGVPTSIYIVLLSTAETIPMGYYYFTIVTPAASVTIEKIATIGLNREIGKVFKKKCIAFWTICPLAFTRVQPLSIPDNTNRRNIHMIDEPPVQVNQRQKPNSS